MSLESLFEQYTGAAPVASVALTGSASHRRYYRLTGADGRTLIGVEGTDADENRAFLTIDRHFAAQGIHVPKVVAVDGLCYLQEDLGTTVLYDALAAGRASGNYGPDEVALLRKTLAALPKIQVEGARGLDFSVCYPQPSFDARMVDFDLNYFKYDFLKLVGVEFNEVFLQDDFGTENRISSTSRAAAAARSITTWPPSSGRPAPNTRKPCAKSCCRSIWTRSAPMGPWTRPISGSACASSSSSGCSRSSAATATAAFGKATKPSPPASPRPSPSSNPFCRSRTIPI